MEKTMPKPIIVKKTRVLRPYEASALIQAIPKQYSTKQFKALLYTGMRYREARRLQRHPGWFDPDTPCINLPEMATKQGRAKASGGKTNRHQLTRNVMLNPVGREIVNSFLEIDELLPSYATWNENMKRWAVYAEMPPDGLSSKTTRKTWESWLFNTYPEHAMMIMLSQGHTEKVSLIHYMNASFTREDKQAMKDFVGGWI